MYWIQFMLVIVDMSFASCVNILHYFCDTIQLSLLCFFLTEPFYWKTKFDVALKCFTDVVDLIARLSQDLGNTWFSEGSQTEWSILLSCLDGVKVYYQSTIDLSSLNLLFKVVLYLACFCLTLRFMSHQRIKAACFWQQLICHWRKLKIKEVLKLSFGGHHMWWENTMSVSQINLLIVFYLKDMIWTKKEYHCLGQKLQVS